MIVSAAGSNETDVECKRVRSRDVFRLGVILMQLIYFEQNHDIVSSRQIERLFKTVKVDVTVRKVIGD